MTERETDLLEMFRMLGKYEQNIIIGKISELILNKKKESLIFLNKGMYDTSLLFLSFYIKISFFRKEKWGKKTLPHQTLLHLFYETFL